MPVKKDDSGRRWVEMEFLVPGTPEQVWQAIATGPGMSAWFTPTTVDERVGGAITFDFGDDNCGDATSSGSVTAWEPPHRFAYEEHGWSGDAPPVATEVVVTSRSGDRCVVRMVHSLFTEQGRLGRRTGELRDRVARLLRGAARVPEELRGQARGGRAGHGEPSRRRSPSLVDDDGRAEPRRCQCRRTPRDTGPTHRAWRASSSAFTKTRTRAI